MIYADPGSGILVWQLLVALIFGATFYFSRLREWASAKLRPAPSSAQTSAQKRPQSIPPSIHAEDPNRQLPGEGE